jgi:hypothetical protein
MFVEQEMVMWLRRMFVCGQRRHTALRALIVPHASYKHLFLAVHTSPAAHAQAAAKLGTGSSI